LRPSTSFRRPRPAKNLLKLKQKQSQRKMAAARNRNAKARAGGADAAGGAVVAVIALLIARPATVAGIGLKKSILKQPQPKTTEKPSPKFTLSTRLKIAPSREQSILVQNNPDQNIRVVSMLALSTRGQNISGLNLCCCRANRFLNTSRTLLSLRP
jgi:hypothetical protein